MEQGAAWPYLTPPAHVPTLGHERNFVYFSSQPFVNYQYASQGKLRVVGVARGGVSEWLKSRTFLEKTILYGQ